MVLVACAVPVFGQAPTSRPPDLFVTRLQGPGSGSAAADPASPQRPSDLQPFPVTELDERGRDADLDGTRRISLTVSRPMPLNDLLLLLVNGTPFSLVNDEAVQGTFVGDLKDLSMRQALEAVLFPRGLDYDVQGTLIRVFPHKVATRLFNINYLNVRRALQRGVGQSTDEPGGSTAALASTSESAFLDDVEAGVRTLLSDSGRMHLDRTAGLVQVTDFADRLAQIAVYVEAAQLRATRQVRLAAHVFEVAFTDGGASSIDWKAVTTRSGVVMTTPAGHGPAGLAIADIEILKRAIGEQGAVTTLAVPQFVATNNEPAFVRVEGLTLTVVPQISADGILQLHVSPSYASRTDRGKPVDRSAVAVTINEADTVVRVQDGETIVFAGFLGEREAIKPPTRFAAMFGGQSKATVKTELVILLTPTIVSAAGRSATQGGY